MILFIGAHTDDIELSCGGTIQQYINRGKSVFCSALSYCDNEALIVEMNSSMKVLKCINREVCKFQRRTFPNQRQSILQYLIELKETIKPDMVFTHHPDDTHQDHSTVGYESIRAFRGIPINFYLHPFNGTIKANVFCDLSESEIAKKYEALTCYHTQRNRSYMSRDAVYSVARHYGIQYGCEFAEVFHGIAHRI